MGKVYTLLFWSRHKPAADTTAADEDSETSGSEKPAISLAVSSTDFRGSFAFSAASPPRQFTPNAKGATTMLVYSGVSGTFIDYTLIPGLYGKVRGV